MKFHGLFVPHMKAVKLLLYRHSRELVATGVERALYYFLYIYFTEH
jgi:hypothetical protein